MKLKKFKKNSKYKRTLLALGMATMCLGGGIILSKSYALYETKKEYNVIKGTVPDFGYDVKLAITVDNKKQETMPSSPKGDNGLYYEVKVNCGSSKTSGLWDYNAWRLNLDYIESNSKCNLTFTSSMTKDQYDEYIKSGVALRRNTYRGKDITDLWKSGDLYKQIEDGTFADIYVGDYIESDKTVTVDDTVSRINWVIADLDNYLGTGDNSGGFQQHHTTIIPAYSLGLAKMNTEATTEGGYAGSEMYTKTLPDILKNLVEPDFTKDGVNHVLTYRNAASTTVSDGISTNWKWEDRKIDLMSEVNVYGTIIQSSSSYDIGIDSRQYALFQLKPELVNRSTRGNTRIWYWLKGLNGPTKFVAATGNGYSGLIDANLEKYSIRPRFLIG